MKNILLYIKEKLISLRNTLYNFFSSRQGKFLIYGSAILLVVHFFFPILSVPMFIMLNIMSWTSFAVSISRVCVKIEDED